MRSFLIYMTDVIVPSHRNLTNKGQLSETGRLEQKVGFQSKQRRMVFPYSQDTRYAKGPSSSITIQLCSGGSTHSQAGPLLNDRWCISSPPFWLFFPEAMLFVLVARPRLTNIALNIDVRIQGRHMLTETGLRRRRRGKGSWWIHLFKLFWR
ncbi:hypothetical protein KCU74_g132, partial [Aureobasidium melanogenum]